MAKLFGGFGKKKNQDNNSVDQEQATQDPASQEAAVHDDVAQDSEDINVQEEAGEHGPFDGDTVNIDEYDFSDFSAGILDLGSMRIPLPKASQVQVEMGDKGPRMLHVITHHGRITPVSFAAPTSGGLWEEASQEIFEGMKNDGVEARFEDGFFGKEVVGEAGPNTMRIIGIDGPRWMLRFSLIGPKDRAEDLVKLAREIAARTFVYRGDNPALSGNSLPVVLPQQLVEQVQQQMKKRQEQANLQAKANQQRAQQADADSLNEAAGMLRNLAAKNDANNATNNDAPQSDSPENKES